jgi:aspartate beta-hydroxylase
MNWKRWRRPAFGPIERLAKAAPLRWAGRLLTSPLRFSNPLQKPYDVYLPGLDSQPYPTPTSAAEILEANWRAIHQEFLAVADALGPPHNANHVAAGKWGTLNVVRVGRVNEQLAPRYPHTLSVTAALPVCDMVTFSVLVPGTTLKPHYGPTNVKHRYQLCLENADGARIRVGDQWREWREGQCLVIDDSFRHEVVHTGDRRRVVLFVDCWHPDLTQAERELLRSLFDTWGSMAN